MNAVIDKRIIKFTSASATHLDGPNTNVLFGNSSNKPTDTAYFILIFLQPANKTADLINFQRGAANSFFVLASSGGDRKPQEGSADDVKIFIRDASACPFRVITSENSASNSNVFMVGSFQVARFSL